MSSHTNLQERLDRYGITARGQIGRGPSIVEIAGYAAAAGASLVMAGAADAQIISSRGWTPVSAEIHPPGVAPNTTAFYARSSAGGIDIDGDNADDITLVASFDARYNGGGNALYRGYAAVLAANGQLLGAGTTTAQSDLPGRNLAYGAGIGTSGQVASFLAPGGGFGRRQEKIGGVSSLASGTGNFALRGYRQN